MKWEKSMVFESSGSVSVDCLSVLLQCVDDVHRGDGFSFSSFGVNDRVSSDSDEHGINELPGGVVWVFSDSLHTSSSGQFSEGTFGRLPVDTSSGGFLYKSFSFALWSLFSEFSFSSHWVLCLKLIIRKCINCKLAWLNCSFTLFYTDGINKVWIENWKLSWNSSPAQVPQVHCRAVGHALHFCCKTVGCCVRVHIHDFISFWSSSNVHLNITHWSCHPAVKWGVFMVLLIVRIRLCVNWLLLFVLRFLGLFFLLLDWRFCLFFGCPLTYFKHLFALLTIPLSFRKKIMQTLITVHMTAIKFTDVANQKHVFIIPIVTFITNVPIKLIEFKNLLLDLNDFPLFLYFLLAYCDSYVVWKIFTATWTSSWWFDPFFDALVTKFMAAAQMPTNVGILIKANCT